MGNITDNKLDAALSQEALAAIEAGISAALSQLPKITLTDEQRDDLKSIDVNNKVFVEDAITEVSKNGAGIIPEFISADAIKRDLTLFEQVDSIETLAKNFLQRISDIKRITGDEAYTGSLAAYRIFDGAAQAGVPNAQASYEKLKVRFAAQGREAYGNP